MDMVVELRKLEGINASFDYGVEIVVMGVKDDPSLRNFDEIISNIEMNLSALFEFDVIVKRGFNVAKEKVEEHILFMMRYYNLIREFKYDEDVYAMLSEPKLVIFTNNRGSIWKKRAINDMKETIRNNGFDCCYEELDNGNVEFRVISKI